MFLFVFLPTNTVAADECPAGTVPITSANRAQARLANIPDTATCWGTSDANVGQEVSGVKEWLAQHATKSTNVSCMNPEFAKKLKSFMEAVPGGPPVITSGYRTKAEQQAIINGGNGATRVTTPCGSYHPWGLAADFNNNARSTSAWMRANAQRFGITTIGEWDYNHFQDAQGKYGNCGECDKGSGGNGVLPDSAGGGGSAPSVSGQIRSALGMPPQPPTPPAAQTPQTSVASTPTQQLTTSELVTTPTSTPVSTTINTNTNTNSNTNVKATTTTATSTFEEILEYADPVSDSIDIGSPALINLNDDVSGTVSRLYPVNSRPQGATGTVASAYVTPPQTFTSPDLAQNPSGFSGTGQQDTTFLVRLYTTLRDSLVLVLQYLRPFGGRAGLQGD